MTAPLHCYTASFLAPSPFGEILLASDDRGLCGLWFLGQKLYARIDKLPIVSTQAQPNRILQQAQDYLECYFAKRPLPAPPPLSLYGSAFKMALWRALAQIPYGERRAYSQVATLLARESSAQARGDRRDTEAKEAGKLGDSGEKRARNLTRAVSVAIGSNPLSIFIPCHRVVGKSGALCGYAGGIERKASLLALESSTLESRA